MKTGEEKWFSTMFVCFVTRFSSDNLLMIMINLIPLTTQSLILVMTGNDSIGGNQRAVRLCIVHQHRGWSRAATRRIADKLCCSRP